MLLEVLAIPVCVAEALAGIINNSLMEGSLVPYTLLRKQLNVLQPTVTENVVELLLPPPSR